MEPAAALNLSREILELFSLLRDRQISYLLVGGVALLKYVEGRNTQDIDLVLSAESLKSLPEIVVGEQNRDFARGQFRSVRVDVLLTSNPLFKLVHQKYATMHPFSEIEVRCATVEGLVLLKLFALPSLYRQGDGQRIALYEADITMLIERQRPKMSPIFEALKPYVDAGAFEELGRIVDDIEKRIARIDAARGSSDSEPTGPQPGS